MIEEKNGYLREKGCVGIFVSKLIPMVRTLISIPAGVMKMNFGSYVVSSALGVAVWNLVFVGGVPISIEHLAEELRKIGHTVYVFAPSYGKQEDEPYVIRYPSFPMAIAGAPVPNILTGMFQQKMRELQIDLIHVHHPAIVGNVALALRRQLGIPVVFTYHTRYEEYLYYVKSENDTCREQIICFARLRDWQRKKT